jgi:hypothetical protein
LPQIGETAADRRQPSWVILALFVVGIEPFPKRGDFVVTCDKACRILLSCHFLVVWP